MQALVEPVAPIVLSSDPTIEGLIKLFEKGQPSQGLLTDEGGRFIGGHALNQDNVLRTAAALSSLWGEGPMDRIRSGDGAIKLYGRRLSLHLMVQPGVAQTILGNGVLDDQGFLSRLLLCWPPSTAGTREYTEVDPASRQGVRAFHRRLEAILARPLPVDPTAPYELPPRRLGLDPEAKVLWVRFHDEVEASLAEGQELAPVRAFANKAAEHAARLAAVLQLIEAPDTSAISPKHMAAGIRLTQFYAGEALRLHHAGVTDPDLAMAQKLLDWLQGRESRLISLPDVYQRGPNSVRTKSTAQKLTYILEDHGWLEALGPAEVDGVPRREVWALVKGQV